jgi:hypothetical protein
MDDAMLKAKERQIVQRVLTSEPGGLPVVSRQPQRHTRRAVQICQKWFDSRLNALSLMPFPPNGIELFPQMPCHQPYMGHCQYGRVDCSLNAKHF